MYDMLTGLISETAHLLSPKRTQQQQMTSLSLKKEKKRKPKYLMGRRKIIFFGTETEAV